METKENFVVDQFSEDTVGELRAAFKAGGEKAVREVLLRVRPGMAEEEIVAVVRGFEEEANAAQAAAEPKPAEQPAEFDPFFGGPDPFQEPGPVSDPFRITITQEMAPVREPEPAAPKPAEPTTPVAAPADDPDDDEEEPEEIRPEDVEVEQDPPPHPEEGRGIRWAVVALIVALVIVAIVLAVHSCGQQEEPAAPAPEPVAAETVLVIDQEQAIAACEARFQGYLTHDECVKAVQR